MQTMDLSCRFGNATGHNQMWLFDDGSSSIMPSSAYGKCIDAGQAKSGGTLLMLWDCNGSPQQQWGYDAQAGRVFLKDTQMCLDVFSVQGGNKVQLSECNSQAQQQFDVNGGANSSYPELPLVLRFGRKQGRERGGYRDLGLQWRAGSAVGV